ncbi:beta-galactosidase [Lysinimonas soli]|uniref:Beta-galactosidase n=1 Tax=Lysinimonas soli TaxID=1074233 RepID=A0ABW0NRV3_9MICO
MTLQRLSTRLAEDGIPRIAFGGDYNPEQWDPAVWRDDVELMRAAGVNLVSVGIFSWALLEVEEGVFEFEWLDQVLDLLHSAGIRVDLANASASPPPWFSHAHPESLPVTRSGVRLGYGSRQAFCPSNPDYRRAAARLTRAIVERYAEHPAVVMWHVHNEYGCHNLPCYCEESGRAFQRWLEKKYRTVDALNRAWGTAFWSQHYTRFDQITPPRQSGASVNTGQVLDFARFSSDELLDCFRAEAEILRAGSSHPVTTNFMGFSMGLDKPIDYWAWSAEMDIVSNDHYLIADDPCGYQELAMTADFVRGLAGGSPWMLMEHSTSAVNWQPRNRAKAPGEMLRNTMQHVARGADAALFFQWRASESGTEKFHSAMVPHGGASTARWREVVELGRSLEAISEVVGSRVSGVSAAIIHDTDARWGNELSDHPSIDVDVIAETRRWHAGLGELGVIADIRRSVDDLSGYALVVVPSQYLMTQEGADNIRRFVENGGIVVVTYFSGIVDQDDHLHPGVYPGVFAKLLGVAIEEFFPLMRDEQVELTRFGPGRVFSEYGRLEGAEALASYASGATAGSPAITRNAVGSGTAYYVGTALQQPGIRAFLELLATEHAIATNPAASADVEIVERRSGARSWLFVINHGLSPVEVETDGIELLSGDEIDGRVTVPAGKVAVVRVTAS